MRSLSSFAFGSSAGRREIYYSAVGIVTPLSKRPRFLLADGIAESGWTGKAHVSETARYVCKQFSESPARIYSLTEAIIFSKSVCILGRIADSLIPYFWASESVFVKIRETVLSLFSTTAILRGKSRAISGSSSPLWDVQKR